MLFYSNIAISSVIFVNLIIILYMDLGLKIIKGEMSIEN